MRETFVRLRAGWLALALLLASWGGAVCAAGVPPDPQVIAVARRAADWQLAHLDGFDYVRAHAAETAEPRGWIQAAFWVGLAAFADVAGDPRYGEAVLAHGRAEGWRLGDRKFHADDQAIGQVWLWAYARTHDPRTIAPLRARFDAILADPPKGGLQFSDPPTCQDRWCWCDALFMAPAAWTDLSQATGVPRYRAYADHEFWATTDLLFDPAERLYYRDSRFIGRKDSAGRKIFWARGDGWAYAGLVDVLKTLPADDPDRPRYEALFSAMSARLIALQRRDGFWAASLLDPDDRTPETSGAGFFIYGLAWGVRTGRLPAVAYAPAAQRGWRALAGAVEADGRLDWVQQVGDAPGDVSCDDTQLYGVGALLLAASQIATCKACRDADAQAGQP
jgi:unsaturated rhamnogalacturonyl hydrolase